MGDKVSAIITTYKRDEKYLKRAIDSVCNQTYENIECIIVDDNGLDSSFHSIVSTLVQQYKQPDKIKLVSHEKNQGAQKARNTGIKQASGKYIGFLDDDDEWMPQKIEKQLKVFKNYPNENLGLVYCWYTVLNEEESGHITQEQRKLPVYEREQVLTELFRNNYIASTSFPLIRKECFEQVGFFDEALVASQDYDMWVRIAQQFEVACATDFLVNYYKHYGEQITSNPEKKAQAEKDFLRKYYEQIKADNQAYSDKNKKIGIYLMRTGKGKEARKHFWETIKLEPIGLRIYKYYMESFVLEYKHKKEKNTRRKLD